MKQYLKFIRSTWNKIFNKKEKSFTLEFKVNDVTPFNLDSYVDICKNALKEHLYNGIVYDNNKKINITLKAKIK